MRDKELARCLEVSPPLLAYYKSTDRPNYDYLHRVGCAYTKERYRIQERLSEMYYDEGVNFSLLYREFGYKTFTSYSAFHHRMIISVLRDIFRVSWHLKWDEFFENYEKWKDENVHLQA